MEGARVYRRAAGYVFRRIRDQVYVAGPDGDQRALGGAAAVVWEALAEPAAAPDLAATISRERSPADAVDPSMVTDALAVLVEAGVVEFD